MKKRILLSGLLLLSLISCSGNGNPTSNDSSSSEENRSSDTNEEIDVAEQLSEFYARISSLEGKVKSTEQTILSVRYYLTDVEPLSVGMKEVSTTSRYVGSDLGTIVVQKGYVGFADDINEEAHSKENFELQLFHDANKFYKITDYENQSTPDSKQVINYDPNFEEENFSLGFSVTEKANVDFMKQCYNVPGYGVKYENIDAIVENGEWEYSYELTIFETENDRVTSIPAQVIGYRNKLTIENNIIIKVEQEYYNELYTGGIKANWNESVMIKTYTQGEFDTFKGQRFDPNNYIS